MSFKTNANSSENKHLSVRQNKCELQWKQAFIVSASVKKWLEIRQLEIRQPPEIIRILPPRSLSKLCSGYDFRLNQVLFFERLWNIRIRLNNKTSNQTECFVLERRNFHTKNSKKYDIFIAKKKNVWGWVHFNLISVGRLKQITIKTSSCLMDGYSRLIKNSRFHLPSIPVMQSDDYCLSLMLHSALT